VRSRKRLAGQFAKDRQGPLTLNRVQVAFSGGGMPVQMLVQFQFSLPVMGSTIHAQHARPRELGASRDNPEGLT
jgi:hypothetical protein